MNKHKLFNSDIASFVNVIYNRVYMRWQSSNLITVDSITFTNRGSKQLTTTQTGNLTLGLRNFGSKSMVCDLSSEILRRRQCHLEFETAKFIAAELLTWSEFEWSVAKWIKVELRICRYGVATSWTAVRGRSAATQRSCTFHRSSTALNPSGD